MEKGPGEAGTRIQKPATAPRLMSRSCPGSESAPSRSLSASVRMASVSVPASRWTKCSRPTLRGSSSTRLDEPCVSQRISSHHAIIDDGVPRRRKRDRCGAPVLPLEHSSEGEPNRKRLHRMQNAVHDAVLAHGCRCNLNWKAEI